MMETKAFTFVKVISFDWKLFLHGSFIDIIFFLDKIDTNFIMFFLKKI